ncbi:MAG: hypothetical protein EZS26_000583 [Candidatus Ordinivivax streblomastigis]|uniref:Lipoprotein n=1 Tax=Candidatus Ordinivivax streblomastigis TaxID=2540710 RepID=A0A5M8P4B9_9BACT|nr:MAG: hypothetical protein EZS26_000384 [Candidatus Ordinivivax streblomastigis]KAA6303423.1 MAG: hypothetical protein EZS26_000583 [Candidatus Ordinivivax streblomastigis]
MKTLLKRKMLFAWMLLLGSVGFIACTSDTLDLENISKNLQVGENLEVPLIKEATLKMADLLDKVTINNDVAVSIGAVDIDSIVALFYTGETQTFSLDSINAGFANFTQDMGNLDIGDMFKGKNPLLDWAMQTDALDIALPTSLAPFLSISHIPMDGFDVSDERKMQYVEFNDVKIGITIDTKNMELKTAGIFEIELQLPKAIENPTTGKIESSDEVEKFTLPLAKGTQTSKIFTRSFILDCSNNTIDANLIFKFNGGDGETKITKDSQLSGKITFAPKMEGEALAKDAFTVWGWFNYTFVTNDDDKDDKGDEFPANIKQYKEYISEETELIFSDPRLELKINSNLGVPLAFQLIELSNKSKDLNLNKIDSINFSLKQTEGNTPIEQIFYLDRSKLGDFGELGDKEDSLSYINLFQTGLDTLVLKYKIGTESIDLDHVIANKIPIQHLSSSGSISVTANAVLPLTLGENSIITYSETMELSFSNSIDLNGSIYIQYKNTLPLDMHLTVDLLKEKEDTETLKTWKLNMDNQNLGKEKIDWKRMDAVSVQTDILKKAKFIRIKYTSNPLTEETSVYRDQYISLQVSAGVNGSINVNLNDTEEK